MTAAELAPCKGIGAIGPTEGTICTQGKSGHRIPRDVRGTEPVRSGRSLGRSVRTHSVDEIEVFVNYLHYPLDLAADDVVEVTLDRQANVRLLDQENFDAYREGRPHHYVGGFASKSPVSVAAPRSGRWHVVVDLGGYPGTVRAAVRVLQGAP